MKTYMSEEAVRLVGRVWEIRRFLKQAQQRTTTDITLLEYLSKQTGYNHGRQPAHRFQLDGAATAYPSANGSNPPTPQLQCPQKTQDRRVIPFPSK
ncbi:Z-ring formation inhibitor MciZ [Paenibacillus piri]|uniref:Z-ring formation inhibitor MciZ n=1 Tax=Paenibacillus piri TaxID=2547395 RepID=A0A4V2ZU38_9BACL|nr:Z-ring formation inhibitor MciZ [Paenibacillus piri]TDF99264.1 Z-ring formation inhibitor MciZ [Paenibacillus piri]